MKKSFYIIFLITISFLFVATTSCKKEETDSLLIGDDTTFSAAKIHYQVSCGSCHGSNLEEFMNREWLLGNSREDIFNNTKNGIEELGMPSFGNLYSDKELMNIADYIIYENSKDENKEKPYREIPDNNLLSSQKFNIKKVVEGFSIGWGMAFLPNGDLLITERSGKLLIYSNGKLEEINGSPQVYARGQGGLLDIILHPDYENNGWIYISYSHPHESGANTAILRAKLSGKNLIQKEIIYKAEPGTTAGVHFGSRMAFDRDGYLYFSVGDRGSMNDAQDISKHNGKIHRIKDDGTIPEDNPFVNTPNAIKSIFAYGNRNPQGLIMHPETGEIWSTEHGPKGGDELNIIRKGKNYGWPVISFGINYDGSILTPFTEKEGMEQPLYFWTPSIAPSGMAYITSDKYSGWKGNILSGSLSFQYLERTILEGEKVIGREKLLEDIGRVRNVIQGPDGYIYVSVESPGVILKLVPVEE